MLVESPMFWGVPTGVLKTVSELAFEGGTSPIPTSLLLCWIKAAGNHSIWSSWSMTSS